MQSTHPACQGPSLRKPWDQEGNGAIIQAPTSTPLLTPMKKILGVWDVQVSYRDGVTHMGEIMVNENSLYFKATLPL